MVNSFQFTRSTRLLLVTDRQGAVAPRSLRLRDYQTGREGAHAGHAKLGIGLNRFAGKHGLWQAVAGGVPYDRAARNKSFALNARSSDGS